MSTFKLEPCGDRVVVEPAEAEAKTQGGIYVPTKQDEKVVRGSIVAVGGGKIVDGKAQPMSLSIGQFVICNQFSGTEVAHEGKTYLIISQDDILAVIN